MKDYSEERLYKLYKLWRVFISLISIFTFCMVSLWFGASALDRNPPISQVKVYPTNPRVVNGGVIAITIELFRHRVCSLKYIKTVHDSKGELVFREEGSRRTTGMEGLDKSLHAIPIPRRAAEGTATFSANMKWMCPGNIAHVIWPLEMDLPQAKFEIVKDANW